MSEIVVDEQTLDRCEGCGGMWFDNLEHEKLKAAHAARAIDVGEAVLGKRNDAMKNVKCPKDGATMIRLTVHEQPHIHLDSCPVCYGTYFDAGEFADFQDVTLVERARRFLGMKPKTT
jgi:Zn-finger nucleic acid-binding protein